MIQFSSLKPVFSIHIPKCAGSSFSKVLKAWFKDKFLRHYPNEKKHTLPIKQIPGPGMCVHGHFNNNRGTGIYDYYPEADQLITVIRDPFEVHVSNYYFVKRKAKENSGCVYHGGKLHPIIENNWSLEDYLKYQRQSYMMYFFPPDTSFENYKDVIENRYIYIGIADELQLFVDRLSEILCFKSCPVPNINQSEREEKIPTGFKERFIEENPLEMEVYRYIKSKFIY